MKPRTIGFQPTPEIELVLRRYCIKKQMKLSEALRRALYEYLQRRHLIVEEDPIEPLVIHGRTKA